jgi:DNA-binding response OmpR family regulator
MAGEKILIVDDNVDLVRGLNIRLSAEGYNMVFAIDAISAISLARKEVPDLILLDIALPGGDGFAVMERLRSIGSVAAVPIIIITGRDIPTSQKRTLNAGAQAVLRKPVNNDVLLAAIKKVLGNNGAPNGENKLASKKGTHKAKGKILIVEDDTDLLRGLNIRLGAAGYNVVFAIDAISAISVARKETPDLILLDIGLPGGDGFVVMERLRFLSPVATVPVIVITGRDLPTNQERALNAGAQAVLQKPVNNDVLLAAIKRALRKNFP